MAEQEPKRYLLSVFISEEENALVEQIVAKDLTNRSIVTRQALRSLFLERGLVDKTSYAPVNIETERKEAA